jgi:hypothetical protein
MDVDSSRIVRARSALGIDDPRLTGLLILLWATTAAFITVHLSNFFAGMPSSPLFDLGLERGYGEVFFQMLTGWAILLLLITAVRRHAGIFLIWAAAAAYLLIDDYFVIHERIGGWFALNARLSAHLGELLWLTGIGAIVILAIAVAYRFARPDIRPITVIVADLFAALAFFGVVVDAIHAPFRGVPAVDLLFTAMEDGGETIAMSLMVVYLVSLAFPAAEAAESHHLSSTRADRLGGEPSAQR